MKRILFVCILILGVLSVYSCMMHGMMAGTDHHGKSDDNNHSMMMGNKMEMEEHNDKQTIEQDGYKFHFDFIDIREKAKGMEKNMGKQTHHLMVTIEDTDGKSVIDAGVRYKTTSPTGKKGEAMAMKMGDGFGGNINLAEKGKHQIEATVKIGDKEVLVKTYYDTK